MNWPVSKRRCRESQTEKDYEENYCDSHEISLLKNTELRPVKNLPKRSDGFNANFLQSWRGKGGRSLSKSSSAIRSQNLRRIILDNSRPAKDEHAAARAQEHREDGRRAVSRPRPEPTAAAGGDSIPLQLYAFTHETSWIPREGIQVEIFDRVYAVLPQINLRLHQAPTGHDARSLGEALAAGRAAAVDRSS